MATTTPVALKGGPCDGRTVRATQRQINARKLTCGGTVYDLQDLRQLGWVGTAETTASGGGGGPDSVKAPRAHKGWHDLRRSVNHNWPEALRDSERLTRSALRSLGRGRRVKA